MNAAKFGDAASVNMLDISGLSAFGFPEELAANNRLSLGTPRAALARQSLVPSFMPCVEEPEQK